MFEYSQRSLKIVVHAETCGIKDATWLEHGLYALSFEVLFYTFGILRLDTFLLESIGSTPYQGR